MVDVAVAAEGREHASREGHTTKNLVSHTEEKEPDPQDSAGATPRLLSSEGTSLTFYLVDSGNSA